MVLYLSVVVAPNRAAASMLIVLTIFPITFIDRPFRLLGTNLLMFIIHSAAAYTIKGAYLGNLDLINCLIATMVGCFCGMFVLEAKLLNFNLARLLAYEKETDILTTLGNRRKLVQTIFAIGAAAATKLVDRRGNKIRIKRFFRPKYPYEYLREFIGDKRKNESSLYTDIIDFFNS